MATIKVFSVHDSKACAFLPPFFMPAKGMAIRSFSDAIAEAKHEFARHPEDYRLGCIGEFDDSSGRLVAYEHVEWLGFGSDFVPVREAPPVAVLKGA